MRSLARLIVPTRYYSTTIVNQQIPICYNTTCKLYNTVSTNNTLHQYRYFATESDNALSMLILL